MSKKQITFTDSMVKKLRTESQKYIRSEGNGFTIRILPSGSKTWLYIYGIDGKRREMNLGNYPDVTLETARHKFEDARRKVKNGIDPLKEKEEAAEKRRKAPTVSDLCTDYIERHAKRFKRSWAKDESILNRDVVPVWGKRKAADIAKRDVVLLLEGIVNRNAPAMANNCFQIIRKMFNWAIEKDILQHTPCAGVKLPSPKLARERVLTEEEIKTLWRALDLTDIGLSAETRRALKLILVTAQRPGEVTAMHSGEIDGRWWTIPSDKAKNGKAHRVYLTDTALDLMGSPASNGYIFPSPVRQSKKRPGEEITNPIACNALAVAVRRALHSPIKDEHGRVLFDKEGAPATKNCLGVDHFTPHDLRRTAATCMAKAGELDEVIDAVLNHSKQGVIKVYNQYRYDREKQAALETWERKLTSILTGTKAHVIPISAGRKTARQGK